MENKQDYKETAQKNDPYTDILKGREHISDKGTVTQYTVIWW